MLPTISGKDVTSTKKKKLFFKKLRFQLCLFLCGAMFCMMFCNLSLSVTVTCMAEDNRPPDPGNGTINNAFLHMGPENSTTLPTTVEKHAKWSRQIQGLMLSSLSWGRLLTPVMGTLADRIDFCWLLTGALATAGIATALIPVSASAGFGMVIAWRVLIGLSDAVVSPGVNQLISAWFPMKVLNSALSWATGGRQMGVLVVYPIGGLFCTSGSGGGWQSLFYLSACLFGLWLLLWIPFLIVRLRRRKKKIR